MAKSLSNLNEKIQSKPSPKVEQALAEAREKTKELKKSMAIQLKKVFDKQLAKHKEETEKLIQELDIIISQN